MRTFNIKVAKFSAQIAKLSFILSKATNLDNDVLADAAYKGAVWIQKNGRGKIVKLRSLESQVSPEDIIHFYYDPKILSYPELKEASCLVDSEKYGVWFKPAGVLSQGSQAADHTSLLRYIERKKKREIFLVHRLDRETAGLIVFAYTSEAAAKLSELFTKNLIAKEYQAIVKGHIGLGTKATINEPLDGKEATTHFEVLKTNSEMSLLKVTIDTGRLHQIRRHLELIGYPVIGDPKYGKGNKNKSGLQLLAKSLKFRDPWTKKEQSFILELDLSL